MLEHTGWDTMAVLNQRQEKIERDRQRAASDRVLRDHFAAAALTGLLANGDYGMESTPGLAWGMADAMLRERERLQNDAPAYTGGISAVSESKLTDAEREAVSFAYDMLCQRARELQAVHAMESSRRCVEASRALQKLFERGGGVK